MSKTNQTIIQDMQILKKPEHVWSSAKSVECYVCGRGLDSGFSITARTLPNGNALFCDLHYTPQ